MIEQLSQVIIFLLLSCNLTASITEGRAMKKENLNLIISQDEIIEKLKIVAKNLDKEYANKDLTMVIVLKGAICFASDLMRELNIPYTIEFIRCSSYSHDNKRGSLTVTGLDTINLKNKDVLIVDDIFDSGATMKKVKEEILKKEPKSLKSIVAFVKKVDHLTDLPDYSLFEVDDKFVIGYGLDYSGYHRGLKGIYHKVK